MVDVGNIIFFWQYFLETLLLLLLVLDSYEVTYGGQKITLNFSEKENNFRKNIKTQNTSKTQLM